MGTSLTEGLVPGADITPSVVGNRLGLSSVNVGIGGTCAAAHSSTDYDKFSLYRLADAIISGDWSHQKSAVANIGGRVPAIIDRLRSIDFSKVTHLGLEYGSNDFTAAVPIGANRDATGATFKGAISYAIKNLLTAFPGLKLFLITPSWRLNQDNLDSDAHPNHAGVFLKDYVDAMIEIAGVEHVPCLDLWRNLGVNKYNYTTYSFDGTHPNPMGAKRRGDVIASFINAVF